MATHPSSQIQAKAHFHRGLAELHRHLFHLEEAALPRAVKAFRLAALIGVDNSDHWAGLGFGLDALDRPEEALAAFRRAWAINPADEEVEIFALTLLCELGPEPEAMAAVEALAKRQGLDLPSLREELTAAAMPVDARTLVMNGFLHARNVLRSRLEDAMERSQRSHDRGSWERDLASQRQDCARRQEELRCTLDPVRVPAELRDVTPWAIRLGVGDDLCRSSLMEGLTSSERSVMLGMIQDHATSIHSWLDTFEDRTMTPEAAAFMYLLLGVEEMNPAAT